MMRFFLPLLNRHNQNSLTVNTRQVFLSLRHHFLHLTWQLYVLSSKAGVGVEGVGRGSTSPKIKTERDLPNGLLHV